MGARVWEKLSSNRASGFPYHRPFHAPHVLDIDVLKSIWKVVPAELSAGLDSPFRHFDLLDIVGLHHSELALRGYEQRRARQILAPNESNATLNDVGDARHQSAE